MAVGSVGGLERVEVGAVGQIGTPYSVFAHITRHVRHVHIIGRLTYADPRCILFAVQPCRTCMHARRRALVEMNSYGGGICNASSRQKVDTTVPLGSRIGIEIFFLGP